MSERTGSSEAMSEFPHPTIYCHYDGYPAHQGRILFDAVTGHFAGDPTPPGPI
jgi:hypothetical protein